jgi:predicted transcriptional regulator YdeE
MSDHDKQTKPHPRRAEAEALEAALHRAALERGCTFRTDEEASGRTTLYSARTLTVKVKEDEVSFSAEYDIRAFLDLYRTTTDDAVRRLLFEVASACCYCIDDKCTTLLMAEERTIRYEGRAKKLCGPYRHDLDIHVTPETLPACLEIVHMVFAHTYPWMHRDLAVVPNEVTYAVVEKEPFYLLGYVQRHGPFSPKDDEWVAQLLKRDEAGRRKVDVLLEAVGRPEAERFVGATDDFVNGASYDFVFGVLAERKPATMPEGAVCRKVRGGTWAVYNSSAGDYKSVWRHFTERFYGLEKTGYDDSRIPFEHYDEVGRFRDVHIPVDAELPADSGYVVQATHSPNERLAGFSNGGETDYPLYRDRSFDAMKRTWERFPHAQYLVRVAIHSSFGKPIIGFDGVPVDDLSVIPEDFETYELQGGYWRRLSYKHFNGGYQAWWEAIDRSAPSAVPMHTMHHPRGFNEYRYDARGGYSEIGIPMRRLGRRSCELVELRPMRLLGKLEAPPTSVVTEGDIRRYFDLPENAERGSYYIVYTQVRIRSSSSPKGGWRYFDKPFVQGVRAAEGAAVPDGLSEHAIGGGTYVKAAEDLPNGVLGWQTDEIVADVEKETGRFYESARPFIYHQLDYGSRYVLYVPVRQAGAMLP